MKNEDLFSRRDFFRKATQKVLPFLGALFVSPILYAAQKEPPTDYCPGSCTGLCTTSCTGSCKGECKGSCTGDCSGSCSKECTLSLIHI